MRCQWSVMILVSESRTYHENLILYWRTTGYRVEFLDFRFSRVGFGMPSAMGLTHDAYLSVYRAP